jgi:hypothetical protein
VAKYSTVLNPFPTTASARKEVSLPLFLQPSGGPFRLGWMEPG